MSGDMTTVEEGPSGEQDETSGPTDRRLRIGAVLAVAVAVGIVVWALVESRGDDGSAAAPPETNAAVLVSPAGLATMSAALGQPIYWLGEREGTRLELQQGSGGNVFVRYLPEGTDAGDAGAHLTVGTYPLADAFEATQALAGGAGAVAVGVGGGGVAYANGEDATNVYVAFPGSDHQIEVFDPTPGAARTLVEQGLLAQVEPPAVAREVTPAELRAFAADRRVYWAGGQPGTTLELSESPERVFVRYLPKGVAAGDPGAYPAIATYGLADAFAQTKALGDQPDSDLIELDGGAVAVFKTGDVTNGYVAFPGEEYQVEVFDPKPGAARALVTAGKITQVK